jgi:hypothetical protein
MGGLIVGLLMTRQQTELEQAEAVVAKLQAEANKAKFSSIANMQDTLVDNIHEHIYDGKRQTVLDVDTRKESFRADLSLVTDLVNAILAGSNYKAVEPKGSSKSLNFVEV